MKLGILLPTFRDQLDDALALAGTAAAAGLDGVFAYDHLYPMGQPERPAFAPFPLLATVASRYPGLTVGPLVARVGLRPPEQVVNQFLSLADAAHGRIIVGLGTGDQLSREENRTWGVPFPSADDRRHEMVSIAEELRQFETWIGGGSEATAALTRTLGATLNLWDVDATRIRTEAARGPVSWAGPTPEQVGPWLSSLEEAGATWAVVTWATEISTLREWREGS